ncbi:MAG: signal peptidase II [Alphaproteobacteria bacterium]|nr:signal peptidase II [Alphaproteobacteria bacterium]
MSFGKKQIAGIFLALCVALSDQWSKQAILELFPAERMWKPVTSFFNLVLVYNHGISFGLFNKAPTQTQPFIFMGIALVISLILFIWLLRTHSAMIATAIGMIIGGAIGNSIDRIQHGAVIDFLDVYATINAIPYHWPAFNVADSAVVGGVALLFIHSLAFDKKTVQK